MLLLQVRRVKLLLVLCIHSDRKSGSRDLDLCMQVLRPEDPWWEKPTTKSLTHIQRIGGEKQKDKKTKLAELPAKFHRVRINPSKLETAH